MAKGHSLRPIPSGISQKSFGGVSEENRESDGLYSAAQRNAEKELKKMVLLGKANFGWTKRSATSL
jgi:hypothetical protein